MFPCLPIALHILYLSFHRRPFKCTNWFFLLNTFFTLHSNIVAPHPFALLLTLLCQVFGGIDLWILAMPPQLLPFCTSQRWQAHLIILLSINSVIIIFMVQQAVILTSHHTAYQVPPSELHHKVAVMSGPSVYAPAIYPRSLLWLSHLRIRIHQRNWQHSSSKYRIVQIIIQRCPTVQSTPIQSSRSISDLQPFKMQ